MTFSKNNCLIMNILTDFQNPDKIKKIRKSWLSDNEIFLKCQGKHLLDQNHRQNDLSVLCVIKESWLLV